ncbi:MAG: hypothetical protein U1F09_16345 [Steroidobacteraceae bacterium]
MPRSAGGLAAVRYTLAKARESGVARPADAAPAAHNACKTCAVGMGGMARGGMRNESGSFPRGLQEVGLGRPSTCSRRSTSRPSAPIPSTTFGVMTPREPSTRDACFPILWREGERHFRRRGPRRT